MLNVAVRVDGKPSVTCAVRLIDYPVLLLTALKLDNTPTCDSDDDDGTVSTDTNTNTKASNGGYEPSYAPKGYKSESVVAKGNDDFTDLSNPASPCVLLKAVLVVLGVVARPVGKCSSEKTSNDNEKVGRKVEEKEGRERETGNEKGTGSQSAYEVTENDESFEQRLQRFCTMSPSAPSTTPSSASTSSSSSSDSSQVKGQGKGQGLEIVCCSELPAGSGKLLSFTRFGFKCLLRDLDL